ncbi:hypothetical protein NPIL_87081 [Nephila pilipes]|uniref:Uncharacterized protein n=1 Tax=Nephila pilipes TaxID=299642 RepID=A0A8X6TEG3_NEPPI|nr:hypothetical protein NPIL_87081 [Nephila pilipes]
MCVMCVEHSFPCEGFLIGEYHISRKRGSVAHFVQKQYEIKKITVEIHEMLHMIRKHFAFSENPPDAGTRVPNLMRYTLQIHTGNLMYLMKYIIFDSVLIVSDACQLFVKILFPLTSCAVLRRSYDREYS